MSDLIGSDNPLTAGAEAALRALAGTIVPACTEYQVPGADDPVIFADLVRCAGTGLQFLNEGMAELNVLAGSDGFAAQTPARRLQLAEQFRISHPAVVGLVVSLVSLSYYRDPRIMESLGIPPRPPFPEGFEVPQGDWSLLEPVKIRPPLYRDVP